MSYVIEWEIAVQILLMLIALTLVLFDVAKQGNKHNILRDKLYTYINTAIYCRQNKEMHNHNCNLKEHYWGPYRILKHIMVVYTFLLQAVQIL